MQIDVTSGNAHDIAKMMYYLAYQASPVLTLHSQQNEPNATLEEVIANVASSGAYDGHAFPSTVDNARLYGVITTTNIFGRSVYLDIEIVSDYVLIVPSTPPEAPTQGWAAAYPSADALVRQAASYLSLDVVARYDLEELEAASAYLSSFWPGDEGSGNMIDIVGDNDLIESGGISSANGHRLLVRANVDNFVSAGDVVYDWWGGSYTMIQWIKLTSLPTVVGDDMAGFFYGDSDFQTNLNFGYYLESGNQDRIRGHIVRSGRSGFGSYYSQGSQFDVGESHMAQIRFNADTGLFGARSDSNAWGTSDFNTLPVPAIAAGQSPISIGGKSTLITTQKYFDGEIWGTAVFGEAITDAELDWAFNAGAGRTKEEIMARDWDIQ